MAERIGSEFRSDLESTSPRHDQLLDDFRTAISWAYDNQRGKQGLALASTLGAYLGARLIGRERVDWLHTGLSQQVELDEVALHALGQLLAVSLDVDDDIARWCAAEIEARIDDRSMSPLVRSRLLSSWGIYHGNISPRRADELFCQAADLVESRDAAAWMRCQRNRHTLAYQTADRDLVDELCALFNDTDLPGIAEMSAEAELTAAMLAGRWHEAIDRSRHPALSTPMARYYALGERAEALAATYRIPEALEVLTEHDRLGVDVGMHPDRNWATCTKAAIELRRQHSSDARRILTASATSWGRRPGPSAGSEDRPLVFHAQLAALLAVCLGAEGDHRAAAWLLGHATTVALRLGVNVRAAYEPLISATSDRARDSLSAHDFRSEHDGGRAANWTEVRQLLRSREHTENPDA